MDVAIQMRSIELVMKFLRHDVKSIPPYGYQLQKNPLLRQGTSEHLPKCSPEETGISSRAVERFFSDVGAEADTIAAHGALVMRHGKVIGCGCYKPYSVEIPHMLYSMSKSITGIAVGMAMDEGLLDLDGRLVDIFPELVSLAQGKILRAHTVKHLLTMSTGSRFNEVGSMLDENWTKMFMESIPKFEAGSAFEYNSLNSYMLAAIVTRRSGMSLTEFLKPRLFEPLGIASYQWEKCPEGIEKGGWGLSLTLEDAAKIGLLYLNRGVYNGRRLLSEKWCDEATKAQIATPNGEMKHGYGYQLWMSDDEGGFQFNGAFGQYVLCIPKYDAVVVVFSGSSNLFAQGTLNEHVERLFRDAKDYLHDDAASYAKLLEYTGSMRFEPTLDKGLGADGEEFRRITELLDGREYRLENNMGSVFPTTIQAVHANYTSGCDLIRFSRDKDGIRIFFYEYDECNAISVSPDGGFTLGTVTLKGESQLTGTRAVWKLEPGRIRLCLICSLLETPDTRIISFDISHRRLNVTFEELPSLNRVVDMLFELVGISQVAYLKRMLPELRREHMEELVRHMTVPVAEGVLVRHNETLE